MSKGKKTGGRPKGIPKKQTVRELVETRLGKPLPEAMLALAERVNSPGIWMDTLKELLPYCYSKLAPIQVAAPLSPEEQVLKDRQMGFLSQQIDDDPNPR